MRYAIYYAPRPNEVLHDVASRWLGRDALRGVACEHPSPIPGIALGELTREPRRYGFHATLKPPFALAEGMTVTGLRSAVEDLARELVPVAIPSLHITRLGDFFALTAGGDQAAIGALAARCVAELDSFRAPMPLSELVRRRTQGLSERQEQMLHRWGYPYVMEDFRFHMTLTGPTRESAAGVMAAALAEHFGAVLERPTTIDGLSIFVEPAAGESFVFLTRLPLSGGPQWSADTVRAAS